MSNDDEMARYKNAAIYGISHPEIYMTKADELWEKYANDADAYCKRVMCHHDFMIALHEYGALVRQRDAEMCGDERHVCPPGHDATYNTACDDCSAAISKEPLP